MYKIFFSYRLYSVFCILSYDAHSFQEIDYVSYFPAVVQATRGDSENNCTGQKHGELSINGTSKIFGTNGEDLQFCSSNENAGMPLDSCDTQNLSMRKCQITKSSIRGLAVSVGSGNSFKYSNGSDGSYAYYSDSGDITFPLSSNVSNQYGDITLYEYNKTKTVKFNRANDGVYIKRLEVGGNVKIELSEGDYWVEKFSTTGGAEFVLKGNVRIFILEPSGITDTKFNVEGEHSLLLFSYSEGKSDSNLELNNGSVFNGYIYSDGNVTLNNSTVNGRITSRNLKMTGESKVNDKVFFKTSLDHYELHYTSSALTCEPAEIKIKVCQNDDCSQLYENNATVTMSPGSGWNINPVVIDNGVADLLLSHLKNEPVVLGLMSRTPDAPLRCYRNGEYDSSCTLNFVDAALRFNIPTFYAGDSVTTSIRAIKSNDVGETKVCVPLLTGNQTLQFTSTKVVSEVSSAVPMINSTLISPSGSAIVPFDSDGVGQLKVQYPDAGVLQLDAAFQRSDVTGTLRLTGSDTVAVIPKAIVIQSQGQSVCSGNNDSTYATCPIYRKAGEPFTLQARAVNAQEQLTPGFATGNKTLSWALLAPVAGHTGAFSPTTITLASGITNVTANWSEVGVIQLGVSNFVPYPAYQDETPQLETVLRWSSPIGRFVPANFYNESYLEPAHKTFSYMDQPFDITVLLSAINTYGGITKNYTGEFAKGSVKFSVANDKNGRSLSHRLKYPDVPLLDWSDGKANKVVNNVFTRLSDTQPDGPYNKLEFGVVLIDNDGSNTKFVPEHLNFNSGIVGGCDNDCNASLISVTKGEGVTMSEKKVYFGRLLAGTKAGPASKALSIPLLIQYYDAGSWVVNMEDNYTVLALLDPYRFSFLNRSQSFDNATGELSLGTGHKIKLELGDPSGVAGLAKDGVIHFHFAKPETLVRIPYNVDLSKQPLQPLWLSDPTSLQGEAIFGYVMGNSKIIYRREIFK